MKALEQLREFLLPYADARVGDRKLCAVPEPLELDLNTSLEVWQHTAS